MNVVPVRSGVRLGGFVSALVLGLTVCSPLRAELWLDSPDLIPRPPGEALAYIASTGLAEEIGGWGPVEFPTEYAPPTCACGQPVDCACGACAACCRCSHGWYGLGFARACLASWDGTLELGLNGAEGNSNTSDLFIGFDGKREYQGGSLKFDLDYFYQTAEALVTADRLVALSRYERDIGSGPLSCYMEGQYEKDKLRNYDGRVALAAGLGAPLTQADRLKIKGRLGAGASKKIGAVDDDWRPELQTGLDYDFHLTARQRLFGNLDYYPDVTRFSTYRLNYKLGWEALLEEDWGLALRASLNNWYDSDPGPGTRANDLYYVLSLAWGY